MHHNVGPPVSDQRLQVGQHSGGHDLAEQVRQIPTQDVSWLESAKGLVGEELGQSLECCADTDPRIKGLKASRFGTRPQFGADGYGDVMAGL